MFADALIAMPREDIHARYENKDIELVMSNLEQRGAELNRDKSWADSTERSEGQTARTPRILEKYRLRRQSPALDCLWEDIVIP